MFGSSFRKLFLRTIFENKLFLLSKFIVFLCSVCFFKKKKTIKCVLHIFFVLLFFKNKKIVFKNYNQIDLFFSFVDLI